MDFNIEIRKKQLDNLDQLIFSARSRIEAVLSYLGWSSQNVEMGNPLVQCPLNPHHRIDPKCWKEHIEKCVVKIEGYDLKSQFLSESVDNPSQSIYIDHNKKIELITKELSERGPLRLAWNGLDPDPRTADRWTSTYSSDERLILYNYAIQNTNGPAAPPEFTTIHNKKQDEEKAPSYEEVLAQQRDAKRRRAKYKSVHINRKNHTEVIREVIDGQMEEYKEWLRAQEQSKISKESNNDNGIDEDKRDQDRPHSSISRTSNHSSSSRSTSKRYDRNKDRLETSRDRNNSKSYDRRNKDRRSPYRRTSEEKRHRNNQSRERDRRRSSRDRSNRRSHDGARRH